jgi:hypothetical protein
MVKDTYAGIYPRFSSAVNIQFYRYIRLFGFSFYSRCPIFHLPLSFSKKHDTGYVSGWLGLISSEHIASEKQSKTGPAPAIIIAIEIVPPLNPSAYSALRCRQSFPAALLSSQAPSWNS